MMRVTEKIKQYFIIRKAVFFFILLSTLCSCSGIGMETSTLYPSEGRKKQILAWAAHEKAKVDEGTIKNSEYWILFYQKSIELRPDLDDYLYYANEMIKASRIFEEGKITEEQFNDTYRQLSAVLAKEEARRERMLHLTTSSYETYEADFFYGYRGSLFLVYINDLEKRLYAAGPQFSISQCDFFGDSIQCTSQKPPF